VSRVLHPARHITGHFRDESFQAIICTGSDNTKQQEKIPGSIGKKKRTQKP